MTNHVETTEHMPQWICTERHGLAFRDSSIVFDQLEQFLEHMEAEHHQLMPRPGETDYAAAARFVEAHPEVQDCPQCQALHAPWARRLVH